MMLRATPRASYRLVLTVSLVGFALVSASVTGLYLYRHIADEATASVTREMATQAKALAGSVAQTSRLEQTRARVLAGDSDVVLAAKSLLFRENAALRMQSFVEGSSWSQGAMLVDASGRVLVAYPERSLAGMTLTEQRPRLAKAVLEAFRDVNAEGLPMPRMMALDEDPAGAPAPEPIGMVILEPIVATIGPPTYVVLTTTLAYMESSLDVATLGSAQAELGFAAGEGPGQAQGRAGEDTSSTALLMARAEVPLAIAGSAPLRVVVSESLATRFALTRLKLRETLLVVTGLIALLGAVAFLLARFFVRPLRTVAAYVESAPPAPTVRIPRLYSELHAIVEEIDRQRAVIDDQFEMLGATIEDLKTSNRRLKQLAEDLRTLSASPDFATMKASLGAALLHMRPPEGGGRADRAWLYARVPDSGRFVRIGPTVPLELGDTGDGDRWPEEVAMEWLADRAGPGLVGYADREGQVSMWMVREGAEGPSQSRTPNLEDDPGDGRHVLDAIAHAASITLDNIRLVERAREEERQRAQIATARIEAELTHLKSQMNPHFLFNALNSVAHLVEVNPNEAVAALARLAKLYRRIMKVSEGVTVTLRDELEVVRLYLEIEQMRFTDRLSFGIHCEVDDTAVQVPGLMIQTLVDNAIKHGIARRASGGSVQVNARLGGESGQDVVIEVIDDSGTAGEAAALTSERRGDRRLSAETGGTGLDNVRRRIGLLFGPEARLTLLVAENGPTVARVVIPGRRLP